MIPAVVIDADGRPVCSQMRPGNTSALYPGVRERADKLLRELVLDDPKPFVPLKARHITALSTSAVVSLARTLHYHCQGWAYDPFCVPR